MTKLFTRFPFHHEFNRETGIHEIYLYSKLVAMMRLFNEGVPCLKLVVSEESGLQPVVEFVEDSRMQEEVQKS